MSFAEDQRYLFDLPHAIEAIEELRRVLSLYKLTPEEFAARFPRPVGVAAGEESAPPAEEWLKQLPLEHRQRDRIVELLRLGAIPEEDALSLGDIIECVDRLRGPLAGRGLAPFFAELIFDETAAGGQPAIRLVLRAMMWPPVGRMVDVYVAGFPMAVRDLVVRLDDTSFVDRTVALLDEFAEQWVNALHGQRAALAARLGWTLDGSDQAADAGGRGGDERRPSSPPRPPPNLESDPVARKLYAELGAGFDYSINSTALGPLLVNVPEGGEAAAHPLGTVQVREPADIPLAEATHIPVMREIRKHNGALIRIQTIIENLAKTNTLGEKSVQQAVWDLEAKGYIDRPNGRRGRKGVKLTADGLAWLAQRDAGAH